MAGLRMVAVATSAIALAATMALGQGYEKEVATLSAAMADQIAVSGKKTVAVVDFTDLEGNVTELGRFLAEEFSAALASSGKGFEVIDRNNLKTILQEHKLATTGIIDPATAKKLGQIAGVDALITGTLTPLGETVRLAIKILDTSTAKVVGASRGDIPKTKAIEELLGRNLSGAAPGASPSSQGGAPSPGGSTAARSPGTQAVSAESENLRFEVQSCKRLASKLLQCAVTITNLDQEEHSLLLWGHGFSLVDDQGDAHRPSRIVFGTEKTDQFSVGFSPSQPMPAGVPVRLRLEVKDVPPEVRTVSIRLEGSTHQRQFAVTLRSIPCVD